ncbi:hypothetical protein HMPREF0551_1217, partial [Lautropia mirabilis ATCC 51599]
MGPAPSSGPVRAAIGKACRGGGRHRWGAREGWRRGRLGRMGNGHGRSGGTPLMVPVSAPIIPCPQPAARSPQPAARSPQPAARS